jgi:Ser/Thr protein kinase RdoA (MazF antagonist)
MKQYNVSVVSLSETQAGWSALAYKVTDGVKYYFLKVYDKRKHTSQNWIRKIDDYMPVLLWLEQNTKLRGRVPTVVLSIKGAYKSEDDDFIYILFDYIHGENLYGKPLGKALIRELAEIVADLHNITDNIPVLTENLIENFNISFCTTLCNKLQSRQFPMDMQHIRTSYTEVILDRIRIAENLAEYLHSVKLQIVLCHTDIHCWNIMQEHHLKLIDWEGVRLAPVEADLFSFSEGFFFEHVWDEFIAAYREFSPVFQLNLEALRFYRLQRLLEDINGFMEHLLYDQVIGEERVQPLRILEKCCVSLRDI